MFTIEEVKKYIKNIINGEGRNIHPIIKEGIDSRETASHVRFNIVPKARLGK
jgi:hypothetical protein